MIMLIACNKEPLIIPIIITIKKVNKIIIIPIFFFNQRVRLFMIELGKRLYNCQFRIIHDFVQITDNFFK